MEFSERDLHIFEHALKVQLKKVRRDAIKERQVFGRGYALDELEEYLGDLICRINKELLRPENIEATNKRLERLAR